MPTTLKHPRKIKKTSDGTTWKDPWKTILFNCDCHSFDQVARQLVKAVHVSYEHGMAIAGIVHHSGSAVVYTGPKEHCEAAAEVLEEIKLVVKVAK